MEKKYHDEEWGVPVHDDRKHFEFLILEGVQAGLSWLTVLRKREHYRLAYQDFDPVRTAAMTDEDLDRLVLNPGLIRNRLKIAASVKNARVFLEIQREWGSFDKYIWHWTGGKPVVNRWEGQAEIPARTDLSDRISADLKKRGMSFVGSTIIYAHLQASGVINDHLVGCYRHREVGR